MALCLFPATITLMQSNEMIYWMNKLLCQIFWSKTLGLDCHLSRPYIQYPHVNCPDSMQLLYLQTFIWWFSMNSNSGYDKLISEKLWSARLVSHIWIMPCHVLHLPTFVSLFFFVSSQAPKFTLVIIKMVITMVCYYHAACNYFSVEKNI